MEEVKLLLIRSSPFAMSCALALREKGIKFEEVHENSLPPKTDRLLRSNPVYKQVPVLIHNGKPVSQSLVILEYIEEAWPPSDTTPSLLPGSAYDRSLSRFWADFINKKFIETGLKLMKRFGEEHATARKEIVEQFITMEEGMRAIGSEGPYFLGDQMSLADVALVPLVPWLPSFEALGELKFPGPEQCGRMHKWLDAMRELPNVVASVPPADWLSQYTATLRRFIAEHYPGGA
uniref:glutathione transferase n=1 Tax=Pinus tabuliformis TaxID=88731 RepID=L7S1R3_PINTB|nr:tau class glutathione S-transferase [Pinus tabuliformis]